MTKKAYETTYSTATRIAHVIFTLLEPRRAVTPEEIAQTLGVDPKTARRYLGALRLGVFDGTSHPSVLRLDDRDGNAIEVDDEVLRPKIPESRIASARLVAPTGAPHADTAAHDLLPLFLAFSVLRYLAPIVSEARVGELWRTLARELPPHEAGLLTDFDRKFYSVPTTPKSYAGAETVLVAAVDGVLRGHVLRVEYYGLHGKGQTHRFEPYTLTMYKGGLYLLGRSDRYETATPITLAVDRIDSIEKVRDEAGEPQTFRAPRDYSPERHFDGVFGIIQGEETLVRIEIQDEDTAERLKERIIHPTQRFVTSAGEDAGRTTILEMQVRGTAELAGWVLGYGPRLRVLEPPELREQVARELRDAAGLYGPG